MKDYSEYIIKLTQGKIRLLSGNNDTIKAVVQAAELSLCKNTHYLGPCPHSGPPSGFMLPEPLLGILFCGIPGGHCMPRPMLGVGISFQWDTLPAKYHLGLLKGNTIYSSSWTKLNYFIIM
jgi:hypothetical protein